MPKDLPNIILIICDTLSAKHMSLYAYERRTTPNLERLVEEGFTVYTRCFAPAPWTNPSHASLFTGLYPSEHKTCGGNFSLNTNLFVISEILNSLGYSSLALSNNNLISYLFKFDKGFISFLEMWHLFPTENFDFLEKEILNLESEKEKIKKILKLFINTNDYKCLKFIISKVWGKIYNVFEDASPFTRHTFHKAIKFILNIPKPYFLFMNIMQTHGKYNPPLPHKGKFSASLVQPIFPKMYKSEEIWFEYYLKKPNWRDYLEYLKALYDEEVLFLDDILIKFIQVLKTQKEYDNTIVIITSDHGELFAEHGHVHHVFTIYNELLHVPLLIKWPDDFKIKGEIANLVQLHDLFSTILDITNSPFPKPKSSKSFLSTEKRKFAISQLLDINYKIEALKNRNPNFTPKEFMQPMMSVITDDFWKITKRLDGHIEIYNLNNDLYETTDLTEDRRYTKRVNELTSLIDLLGKITGFDKAAVKPLG